MSQPIAFRLRRAIMPLGVFIAVAAIHFVWLGLHPEHTACADDLCTTCSEDPSWLLAYISSQSYWLGFSYALSASFAAVAWRRYREGRVCAARNFAIGGITLTGFLAVAGCFLIGCCGSPMLIVWLNLFGAKFLPLAKPLIAAFTAVSVLAAWWWMNRYRPLAKNSDCDSPECACNNSKT